MDLGINREVALVTRGSRGLGRQSALSLAGEGVDVAVCGRTRETLDQIVDEIQALGVKSIGVVADVSKASEIERLHEQVAETLGPVDILVNNAGGSVARTDVVETSLEDFQKTFDLNVFGSYQLMKLVIPHMKEQEWGRIINIASIWGREYGGNIGYMSAKSVLISTTKHAAVTLAKDGILVNSIAPGSVAHSGGGWEQFQNESPPEVVQNFIEQNLPMGKFGWPEPVGDLVAFLASQRAGLLTSACIVVDGELSHSMI